MITANDYLNTAAAYVGVKEGTQRHKEIINIYNSITPLPRGYKVTYNDAWCAAFVSAMAWKAHYTGLFPYECGVPNMIQICKTHGLFSHTPTLGGLIFFDWNGGVADHVGIVRRITTNTVSTIEGNKSNAVGYRTINLKSGAIVGYANLKFAETATPKPQAAQPNTSGKNDVSESIDYLARQVIAGKFGNGEERKNKIYNTVQANVNSKMKYNTMIDERLFNLARAIINGEYGNGDERKNKIYNEVQARVNQLLK